MHLHNSTGLFFQRFCKNSAAKKTQFLPSAQKLKAIFVKKFKVRAAFILNKICEKTQKVGKKLRFSLKTQHRGSLRLLKSAPKPLKK